VEELVSHRVSELSNSFSGQLSKLVTQINVSNQKKSESMSILKEETVLLKNEISLLKANFNECSR